MSAPARELERPRIRPVRLLVAWVLSAAGIMFAAWVVPGVELEGRGSALVVAAVIAVLNAVLPPLLAALRLPFTLVLGLLLVLVLDAAMFMLAADLVPERISVDSWWSALATAFVASVASVILDPIFRTNDDETYMLRVTQRIARRSGEQVQTDVPGIVFLEIDGLALPVLRRAMRDGSAPEMARWVADGDYELTEWETDLSSQTGASQAGILLGSNEDIPAFRWIEKESGRTMTCSRPADCEEIERRRSTGVGLLRSGGASRGNLLSGEADHLILTVSRLAAEKRSNPGYRAFFANGFNVTRVLVLFAYEVVLEWTAAIRSARRDVRPRGHRGGKYPFLRAAMCVVVRDLIVYGVISDMMRGRPAVYATFSSYDEVAHHSGLERADTLEALRKLDQQFGRIMRARPYAPRPYELVVLSDHGQTQGATFLQRNGYGLVDLVSRSLSTGAAAASATGDETNAMVGLAAREATGARPADRTPGTTIPGEEVAVLGSGNLGLVYLLEEQHRMTLEEIEARHPLLIPALRNHPHVGFVLVRSDVHGPVALGARGTHYLADGRVDGEDPLVHFSPNAALHLRRTDAFPHVADLVVNSFYDPQLDEGCAFEELISFHGGLGGPQTCPFILHPATLRVPDDPIVGAAAVHRLLTGWRESLEGGAAAVPAPAGARARPGAA
ncbi:MAG TPA: phage holin family protein [Gaiellaceae bacterium]|nr:phage holin family protein [Gaiellaceae bacterium]